MMQMVFRLSIGRNPIEILCCAPGITQVPIQSKDQVTGVYLVLEGAWTRCREDGPRVKAGAPPIQNPQKKKDKKEMSPVVVSSSFQAIDRAG